ncbi:hypothetical protein QYE76_004348 [Lolium multiflorum]|uniref:Uncharacterized protein n=1 Tax=Lolium multiflorum TaxID=4521 RepID=A0AAD8W254_LOLMU|nr:hypothetical protein QYE76_004348 [Lolium multiflorum]
MVQKLSLYEQRHPEVYQDKFKRAVVLVEADEDEGSAGDQEVAVAEWTGGQAPCANGLSHKVLKRFDRVTKGEQIFDLLLKEKTKGFSFSINMVGPGHHSGKDRDEGSCSHNKDKEEAVPRDRLRHDGKRYITEGEVKNWDGDEVEVVQADDSAEISTAGMNVWETSGQEPLSGITLDDCERIDVTKDGVRLVLSTGLTV